MKTSSSSDRMDTGQYVSDDDDIMTSSGDATPLLDVDSAAVKASEIRRVNLMNLVMMSSIFLLQNVAFSIYYDDVTLIWKNPDLNDWWFISKTCFFSCYLLAAILAPFVCDRLRDTKQWLLLGSLAILTVVIAQLIPRSFTLIPAAVFAGLTLPFYFTSQGAWLTICSHRYACPLGAKLVTHSPETSVTLFHAVFHALYLSGPAWRSLLNLPLLGGDSEVTGNTLGPGNGTCGFDECLVDLEYSNTNRSTYRIFRVEALLGSYLTFALAAVLLVVFCFTSPILNTDTNQEKRKRQPVMRTVCPTSLEHYLLFVTLSLALGIEQYFIYNIYPKVLISGCFDGWYHTLFIICISGVASVFALLQGVITSCVGRCKLFLLCGVVFLILCITLAVLPSHSVRLELVFTLGCMWAAVDSVWQTQLSALLSIRYYGVKKFAFSSLRFWQMAGFGLCYYLSKFLCERFIIYVTIPTFIVAMVTFVTLEIRLRLREEETRHFGDSHYKLHELDDATWIPTLNPLKHRQRSALINTPAQHR